MTVRKICILGLEDYPMLTGANGYIGGECVQHVLLARAFRDLGLEVSIIVHDHGQPRRETIDGLRAVSAYAPQGGVPMLRFFHPRISSVWRAMREIDADVYYQSPSSVFTGIVAAFARRQGKRSLVRIASDLGCMRGQQLMRHWRDRKLYDYGLRNASMIAAQTTRQQQLLREQYGLASEVVNIAVEIPAPEASREKDIDVLWVGNLRPVKRPEWVLDLARRMPERRFTIAGGPLPRQHEYYERFLRSAAGIGNVQLLGAVPYAEVGALFERAKVHLNTSSAEGFPNTFLQAWVRRVPVVSCFDPDHVIRQRGLGRTVADFDEMVRALGELLEDPAQCAAIGERARKYTASEFSAARLAHRYLELLDSRTRAPAPVRVERAVAGGGR